MPDTQSPLTSTGAAREVTATLLSESWDYNVNCVVNDSGLVDECLLGFIRDILADTAFLNCLSPRTPLS